MKLLLLIGLAAATAQPPLCVAVVACSMHYRDFFDNWAAQLAKLRLETEVGVVAIAEDEDVAERHRSGPAGPATRTSGAASRNSAPS